MTLIKIYYYLFIIFSLVDDAEDVFVVFHVVYLNRLVIIVIILMPLNNAHNARKFRFLLPGKSLFNDFLKIPHQANIWNTCFAYVGSNITKSCLFNRIQFYPNPMAVDSESNSLVNFPKIILRRNFSQEMNLSINQLNIFKDFNFVSKIKSNVFYTTFNLSKKRR